MRRDTLSMLRVFRGAGLDLLADEKVPGVWHGACLCCLPLSDGLLPLRITETRPGRAVELRCINGCDEEDIFAALERLQTAAGGGRRPGLRVLDVERMLVTEPPSVPWIAPPLLARGAVTMLVGREGQGKSMFGLGLGGAIGRGDVLAGIACPSGRVLVVDAENGEAEAWRRIRGLGVTPGTLVYVEADGFDLRSDMRDLEALVAKHRPDVLMLDSLRSLAPGLDENDSAPVEAVLGPLRGLSRGFECASLVLHHAGKAGRGYRGSTAIGAGVDLGFELCRHEYDPQARTRRELSCWKSRIAAEPVPLWISLDVRDGRVAIEQAEPFTRIEAAARGEDALAQQLGAVVAARGELRKAELCAAAGVNPNAGSTARAIERGIETGDLAKVRHGYYGPPERSSIQPAPRGGDGWMNAPEDEEQAA